MLRRRSPADRLRAIIVMRGLSQAAAAKELGCSDTMVCLMISGDRVPGGRLAASIESWSKGKIRASEWFANRSAA